MKKRKNYFSNPGPLDPWSYALPLELPPPRPLIYLKWVKCSLLFFKFYNWSPIIFTPFKFFFISSNVLDCILPILQFFCSTSFRLASTRWVCSTFSSHGSLSKQRCWLTSATLTIFSSEKSLFQDQKSTQDDWSGRVDRFLSWNNLLELTMNIFSKKLFADRNYVLHLFFQQKLWPRPPSVQTSFQWHHVDLEASSHPPRPRRWRGQPIFLLCCHSVATASHLPGRPREAPKPWPDASLPKSLVVSKSILLDPLSPWSNPFAS